MQILCVLLLQNVGLKSKDTSARCMAIDLLGTIATRLKRDYVICNRDRFWILQELDDGKSENLNGAKDACSVCLKGRGANVICHVCQRYFHADCMGLVGQEISLRDWSCHLCVCKKQLKVLQSYCKLQNMDNDKKLTCSSDNPDTTDSMNRLEVIQQIILNYLNETGPQDDSILFTCWLVILTISILNI